MSTSSSPREIIQISLGPSANAVTAHLLNLQGLAATSSSSSSYCDPNTTHYVQGGGGGGGTLVPRVLMIDEATHRVPITSTAPPPTVGENVSTSGGGEGTHHIDSSALSFSGLSTDHCWNGQIQVLGDGHHDISNNPFWNTASALAYSPHSRYHRPVSSSLNSNDHVGNQYRADPENSRHVVWDDNEDEEESDEEDPYERTQRQERAERRWKTETAVQLGQDLDRQVAAGQQQQQQQQLQEVQEEESLVTSTQPQQQQGFHFNHWSDIWMPPRDEKSKCILPYSSQSQFVPHWNVSYQQNDGRHSGGTNSTPFLEEWKEDVLFERLRHMLEACDYGIQGVSIATEGHGIYASLATCLLEELQQECKSAGRLIYHVTDENNNDVMTNTKPGTSTSTKDLASSSPPDTSTWQEAQVNRVRNHISSGLALYDFTEKAHAILPLRLSAKDIKTSSSSLSWFRATAQIAMALESCTLPFRFNGQATTTSTGEGRTSMPEYQMGLQNAPFLAQGGSDTSWGSTATRLTFSEYLNILQPSSSHSMLELDILSQSIDKKRMITNQKLYDSIRQGTSVERDHRTRRNDGSNYRSRPRETPPGSWLHDSPPLDSTTSSTCRRGGLLTSLSYINSTKCPAPNLDRSLNHHFALSTSVRPILLPSTNDHDGITMSNYLTCLVQSMGIQYRPERSMATVLDQSIGQLTCKDGGGNYGAGIYWKHLLPEVDAPILAVLGNTTRAYSSLNGIATDMKDAMRASRFRGYFNRDILNGVLPEVEDCEEAMEACLNKRDIYHPPQGSGLVAEDDGDY